jgi:hypothetical protein
VSIFANLSSFEVEKFDDNKKFSYAAFANGIWLKRKEPVGTFVIKANDIDLKSTGLTKNCEVSFEQTLPKIPVTILSNIVEFFRVVKNKMKSEVYISIYWDIAKQDYFLYVPTQRVAGATVNFENDATMLNNPNYFIVMDIH